jgi:hypothetical protein
MRVSKKVTSLHLSIELAHYPSFKHTFTLKGNSTIFGQDHYVATSIHTTRKCTTNAK